MWDILDASAYDSVWKEVLYNTANEFGTQMKAIASIQLCLNETYNAYHIRKNLCGNFLFWVMWMLKGLYRHLISTLL
jgi:hypothetical protein